MSSNKPFLNRICEECGEPYKPTSNSQKYCSDKCRALVRIKYNRRYRESHPKIKHTYKQRTCEICHEPYTPASANQKYCNNCQIIAERRYRKNWIDKQNTGKIPKKQPLDKTYICQICDEPFNPNTNNQKYCSDECRAIARSKYNKTYQERHPEKFKRPKYTHVCKNCGNTFEGTKNQIFCDTECRQYYYRKSGYYDRYKSESDNTKEGRTKIFCELTGISKDKYKKLKSFMGINPQAV